MQKIDPNFTIPSIDGELDLEKQKVWNSHLGRALMEGYQLLAYRVNKLTPLDGSEAVANLTVTTTILTAGLIVTTQMLIPTAAAPAPTLAGDTAFGTNKNALFIGNGASSVVFRSDPWETIAFGNSGSVAAVSFTDLSPYIKLRFGFSGLVATNAVTIGIRTSSNNGSSYDSGATDYLNLSCRIINASVTGVVSNQNQLFLDAGGVLSNTANSRFNGLVYLHDFNKAVVGHIQTDTFYTGTVNFERALYGGYRNQATARDAFQMFASSGNITIDYVLEGIRG